jgi:site-specific recombinase XerD
VKGDWWAETCLDQRQIQLSKSRKFSQLSYHSLRHSFSSALANAGISADVRMKLTGHKSIDVHQRYTHIELEPLKKAIAALPGLNGEAK